MANLDGFIPNVDIPEGAEGGWRVIRVDVSEEQAKRHNLMEELSFIQGHGDPRRIKPGWHTELWHGSTLVMSDTWAEKLDHIEFTHRAKGLVLINGLGIGMALNAAMRKRDVHEVVVIEQSSAVIALVGDYYSQLARSGHYGVKRLTIIQGDAMTWKPGKGAKYDAVWHDIWNDIQAKHVDEMSTLKRRYGPRLTKDGWQGCWCQREMLASRRKLNAMHFR